jgi:hypothetical protein
MLNVRRSRKFNREQRHERDCDACLDDRLRAIVAALVKRNRRTLECVQCDGGTLSYALATLVALACPNLRHMPVLLGDGPVDTRGNARGDGGRPSLVASAADRWLATLSTNCRRLETARLTEQFSDDSDAAVASAGAIEAFLRANPQLTELQLESTQLDWVTLAASAAPCRLHTLDLVFGISVGQGPDGDADDERVVVEPHSRRHVCRQLGATLVTISSLRTLAIVFQGDRLVPTVGRRRRFGRPSRRILDDLVRAADTSDMLVAAVDVGVVVDEKKLECGTDVIDGGGGGGGGGADNECDDRDSEGEDDDDENGDGDGDRGVDDDNILVWRLSQVERLCLTFSCPSTDNSAESLRIVAPRPRQFKSEGCTAATALSVLENSPRLLALEWCNLRCTGGRGD